MGLVVATYLTHGRSTAALAVASFAVLSLQLAGSKKPRFAQLTSSVFGLFYCGMPARSMRSDDAVDYTHVSESCSGDCTICHARGLAASVLRWRV